MIESTLRRPPALVFAAAAAPLLVLSACGGSDSPAEPQEQPRPTTIQVSPATLSFESLGDREPLTATVLDQDGNALSSAAVTWASADQQVATVTSRGEVRSYGNGTVSITATAGGATGQASVTVAQVAVTADIALDSLVLPWSGAATTLAVAALDAGGSPLADGAGLVWASSDEAVAAVDSDGTLTGLTQGTADIVVTVTSGGADTLAVRVASSSPGAPFITAVDPAPLVEGDTVTISGSDFGGQVVLNQVVVDGVVAQLLSASATELTAVVPAFDCQPRRDGQVVVRAFGEEADAPVTLQPVGVVDIPVGEAVLASGDSDCLQLAGADGTPRYMVGILSTSGTPSGVTPARLNGEPGTGSGATVRAASGAAVRLAPVGPASPSAAARAALRLDGARLSGGVAPTLDPIRARHARMEAELRRVDRERFQRLGPQALARPGSTGSGSGSGGGSMAGGGTFDAQSDTVGAGDVINLRYGAFNGECNEYEPVSAVVRIVSDHLVVAEDPTNPAAGRFSDEYLRQLVDEYDDVTWGVLTDYFGDFTDIDRNGRLIVLITRRVNDEGGLLGFVTGRDFLQPNTCAGSNRGEVFYVATPDPEGETETPFGMDYMERTFPGLMGHEASHVIQTGAGYFGGSTFKTSWEVEGGATLAEQLIGFRLAGFTSTDNVGWDDLAASPAVQDRLSFFRDWWTDMALYFGYRGQDDPRALGAPATCSWAGRSTEGNNGPCINGRAPYGTPAMFFRMVLDRYGPAAGGAEGLMRQLTLSTRTGVPNLAAAVGRDADELLAEYSIALWADDVVGDWIPSWNKADIFSELVTGANLAPAESFSLAPEMSTEVRGLSTFYSFWEPGTEHPPMAFRLDDASDGQAAEHMRFWVLRIQ